MNRLNGVTAIITGAASGMGAASARRYVEEGARVLLADIDREPGEKLAADLGEAAAFHPLDVSDESNWSETVAACIEWFGLPNVLVNTAGILHFAGLTETSLDDYRKLVNVNQIGTFLGMRTVADPMRRAGGGSVINFSSIEGLAAMPMLSAYTATKFAIRGMTKVAALELGEHGIRVNSVHPGMIQTPMVGRALGTDEVDLHSAADRVPLRRVGTAADIAELVVFLGSTDSAYSTGAEFVADGGVTAAHGFGAVTQEL